jgi:glycogen synthase
MTGQDELATDTHMKILLQHAHLECEISGVLTSLNELMPELASRSGVEVRLLSTKLASARAQLSAVRWADAVMLNSNCLLMALAGRFLAKRTLLKLHYPQYQTVHWHFIPMSFVRRIATEVRHLVRQRSTMRYKVLSIGRLMLRTLVALVVSRVGACSRYCADQASLPRPIVVLRNPIRAQPGLPARRLSMIDVPYRFVYMGRVTYEKGWDTLVEASSLVAATGRRFVVDIVGAGDALDEMKAQVVARGLGDLFRFHGRLDSEAAQALLTRALSAVMPSKYQEAAGYVPLEAAAHRVASIVAQVGGLPETAGPHCPTFPSGSALGLSSLMTGYLDNPLRALDAGHASYLRAIEDFSPTVIADELLQALKFGRATS